MMFQQQCSTFHWRSVPVYFISRALSLTHLPLVPRIRANELGSIGSGNRLSPGRRQAITCTNVDLWSIRSLLTNFSEIQIKTQDFSFVKMHLKCRLRNGGHFDQGQMSELTPDDVSRDFSKSHWPLWVIVVGSIIVMKNHREPEELKKIHV